MTTAVARLVVGVFSKFIAIPYHKSNKTKKLMSRKKLQSAQVLVGRLSRPSGKLLFKYGLGVGLLLILASSWTLIVHADTIISRSYLSDERIPIGSIVSIEEDTSDRVEPANVRNVDNILGVVVNEDSSLIRLSGSQDNRVQVATDGALDVLVSDINGDISRGDHITASPIDGIGMKATSNIKVVGIAQGNLNQDSGRTETYTDADGEEHEFLLGEVPVKVNVAYYFKEPDRTIVPATIQNVANAIAGRPVEPLPIIISGVIFVVTMIAVGSIIFSMIRNSIISVGRNPMSQSAVYRNVMQLTALVLGILTVSIASIYMILTRL